MGGTAMQRFGWATVIMSLIGGWGIAQQDDGKKPVPIPDKNLEAALRAVLLDPKGDLTEGMLANVFVLEAKGKKIANLAGLEKCKNLSLLNVAKNAVADLTPLKDLKNLQSLDLSGNKVSDLKPLKDLTRLSYLELSDNEI